MAKSHSVIGGFQKIPKNRTKSDEDYYDNKSKKKDRNKRNQIKNKYLNSNESTREPEDYSEEYSNDFEFVEV